MTLPTLKTILIITFSCFLTLACSNHTLDRLNDKKNQADGFIFVLLTSPLRSFSVTTEALSKEPLAYNIEDKSIVLTGLRQAICDYFITKNISCTNGKMTFKPRLSGKTHERLISLYCKKKAMIARINNHRVSYRFYMEKHADAQAKVNLNE